jgi:hypothetical protein
MSSAKDLAVSLRLSDVQCLAFEPKIEEAIGGAAALCALE